jgi:hypothetical protein
VRAYEKAMEEWSAKQAAEKARVEQLGEQIRNVEKGFKGKVRFESPIDGHTAEDVDQLQQELQRLGR